MDRIEISRRTFVGTAGTLAARAPLALAGCGNGGSSSAAGGAGIGGGSAASSASGYDMNEIINGARTAHDYGVEEARQIAREVIREAWPTVVEIAEPTEGMYEFDAIFIDDEECPVSAIAIMHERPLRLRARGGASALLASKAIKTHLPSLRGLAALCRQTRVAHWRGSFLARRIDPSLRGGFCTPFSSVDSTCEI